MGKMFDALQKSAQNKALLDSQSERKGASKVEYETEEKANKDFGINLIPERIDTIDKHIIVRSESRSLIADQFRILRTEILRKFREKSLRSLLITSAMPKEGKTTIASNLAVGITQCINEKAVLLDFDLRKANIAPMFGLNGRPGILEYMSKETELSEIICTTDIENLLLITAGASSIHPSDILSAAKVERLFNDLESRYKDYYIIIDSTPLELTPEVSVLADQVDAILFVIGAQVSKRDQISSALKKVNREKIIGIAFNGVDQRLSYYKSYYKNYYNSYGKK